MHHIQSPDTSDPAIEREILHKGKTAPRVTPASIEASIASEHYFTAAQGVECSGVVQPVRCAERGWNAALAVFGVTRGGQGSHCQCDGRRKNRATNTKSHLRRPP